MLEEQLKISQTPNGKARLHAVKNTVELSNLIPPTVNYQSHGHLLIVGPTQIIEDIASQFTTMATVTLLSTDGVESRLDNMHYADAVSIVGFLGTFTAEVTLRGVSVNLASLSLASSRLPSDCFDVVLDMTLDGFIAEEVPPPGYFPVGRGNPSLSSALVDIPTLIGSFEKPKYFRLNTDLCAHSSRGVKGCERCVDACPTGALISEGNDDIGHRIEINPYLCQGIGTCATTCPTEAIKYALPNPEETQKFIERTLANYRHAGGRDPIILICSVEFESDNTMALDTLPDNIIPIHVEELPSVGIDTWFAALVNGAHQVLFAASQRMPTTTQRVLSQEVQMAQTFLKDLGLPTESIDIFYLETLQECPPSLVKTSTGLELGDLSGNKRERLFLALDALRDQTQSELTATSLTRNAAYGSVNCSDKDCTLCMACVAVCPTAALHNEGDKPALKFIEQDCVQCGLCTKACPENALSLEPRINWDKTQRQQAISLYEEDAAECLRCQKPFAPQSMVTMLQNKLRGHVQFSDETALRRIAMCEDCRVVDVFEAMAEDPVKQLNY